MYGYGLMLGFIRSPFVMQGRGTWFIDQILGFLAWSWNNTLDNGINIVFVSIKEKHAYILEVKNRKTGASWLPMAMAESCPQQRLLISTVSLTTWN